jgi:hypothetical protein
LIKKLHAELLPLVDQLQEAGARGVYNLGRLPYRGQQWELRAIQKDPFLIAFAQILPPTFGTFERCDELLAQRRLVYHSDALHTDLVLRRRGAFRRPSSAVANASGSQEQYGLFPAPRPKTVAEPRLAALIWDTPTLNDKHEATGPTPIAVRLAKQGFALDDNRWEASFKLQAAHQDDLIPERTQYSSDLPDWDVDDESGTQ